MASTPIACSAAPSCGPHALELGQLMAHHLARQRWVQWLATALGALVAGYVDGLVVSAFLSGRLGGGTKLLGFVEEYVLLVRAKNPRFGCEQLALELVELLPSPRAISLPTMLGSPIAMVEQ